ncbi:dorsal-related immunity factor Dif-like [Sitodiplosis mosellana]|uniref:dorsal-related immunity factor Dif-like n=1 Tax=Sitodiplosis mosellana TaxID=263140 RepID=UPI002444E71A|nr:dorsal-related immunity factor Dif-like [Sitodiplosis mosellana]
MATNAPYLKIIEQPAGKSCRFRYESEGRHSGSIFGVNSTKDKQTYPTIEVGNVTGKIGIRITCVTNNDNGTPKQHPHKLTTKEVLESGAVLLKHNVTQRKKIEVKDVGIVFVKKQRIHDSLKQRKSMNIDPTKGGWDYIERPHLFDLHCVRMCFEAFLYTSNGNATEQVSCIPIGYVLSDPIMDKKSNGSLKIIEMNQTSSVSGGERIFIFCDKVKREDISVLFYEENADRQIIWKEEINYKNSESLRVHHQYGIALRTPSYNEHDIQEPRKVFVQLIRPSDSEVSEPIPFTYLPNAHSIQLQRKKQTKVNESVKKSLSSRGVPLKKAEKPKFIPNILDENILPKANRTNSMERPLNPPKLINLGEDDKENGHMNNQAQNGYQTSIQPHYQHQMTNTNSYDVQYNFPCGTYSNSNYPSYYYTPYAQHQNANGFFGEPSIAQASCNPQPILQPTMSQQPSQSNGQQHDGYMNRVMNPIENHSTNSAINCIPFTYNNDNSMDSNKTVENFATNAPTINDNAEEKDTNYSDLVHGTDTSELIKLCLNEDSNVSDIDGIGMSFDSIKL